MLRELRRPTPETLMLQRDMEKLRENLRQEQTLFNAQKTQMDKRLQEEVCIGSFTTENMLMSVYSC